MCQKFGLIQKDVTLWAIYRPLSLRTIDTNLNCRYISLSWRPLKLVLGKNEGLATCVMKIPPQPRLRVNVPDERSIVSAQSAKKSVLAKAKLRHRCQVYYARVMKNFIVVNCEMLLVILKLKKVHLKMHYTRFYHNFWQLFGVVCAVNGKCSGIAMVRVVTSFKRVGVID